MPAAHPRDASPIQLEHLGLCYSSLGRFDLAVENARRAADIQERAFGPGHPNLILPLSNLAAYLTAEGRYQEALQTIQRARTLALRQDPEGHNVAMTQGILLSVLTHSGRYREAIETGQQLEELRRRQNAGEGTFGLTTRTTLYLKTGLSKVYLGRAREGLALCERAMDLLERLHRGPALDGFQCIGEAQLALGRPEAARLEWSSIPAEKESLAEVESWLAKLGP